MNGPISEAVSPEFHEVGLAGVSRFVGQLRTEVAETSVGRVQRRRSPIPHDPVDKRVGFCVIHPRNLDLFTEIVRVRLGSVEAVQLGRDDGGQKLPLKSAKWRVGEHDRRVVRHAGLQHRGINAHDLDDVPDPA